jgi:hypothetical protein
MLFPGSRPDAAKERTMIDLGWSAPANPVDAAAARRAILEQHTWIRVVLETWCRRGEGDLIVNDQCGG